MVIIYRYSSIALLVKHLIPPKTNPQPQKRFTALVLGFLCHFLKKNRKKRNTEMSASLKNIDT